MDSDSIVFFRWIFALGLGFCAVGLMKRPNVFFTVSGWFKSLELDPKLRERLDKALRARESAESMPRWYGIPFGLATLVLAALELAPQLPPIVPYAIACVVLDLSTVWVYLHVKRAGEKRVALLTKRRPFDVLGWLFTASVLAAIASTVGLATMPSIGWSALVVAASSASMLWIAWRIAEGPAYLLGDDLPVERFIDDRIRLLRTTSVAFQAALPMFFLVSFIRWHRPQLLQMAVSEALIFVAVFVSIRQLQFAQSRMKDSSAAVVAIDGQANA